MRITIIVVSMVLLILLACDKGDPNAQTDLSILKVDYSGCFSTQNTSLKSLPIINTDSLYFELNQSVLSLKIDMVYNCCGFLKDSATIRNDIINIYIYDRCQLNCLCKCLCLFKFNYFIIGFSGKNTSFNIYLKGYNEKDYSLWKESKYYDR